MIILNINESVLIEKIRIIEVDIPYAVPFQISGGVSYSRKSLIIEMEGEGLLAYGESAPFEAPFYSSETISSAKAMLTEWLIPRVIGRKINSIQEMNDILSEGVRGNNFAKAGLETAYWDLVARKNNISIKQLIKHKLLELETSPDYMESKDYIFSGVSVGIPTDNNYNTLARWIEKYVEEGYQRIKVKVKPGWDLKAMEVSRQVIGSEFPFWIDANSSFNLKKHEDILRKMDDYNCLFLEQPLHHDDILDHNKLKCMIKTPICFDESLKSSMLASQIVELGVSKIWNIKIQRVGGLLEAVKIYSIASKNGTELWGGTMPESGVGAVSIMALASFSGFKYAADVEASSRWYGPNNDIVEINMDKNGKIYLEDSVGIGEINLNNYKKYGKLVYKTDL